MRHVKHYARAGILYDMDKIRFFKMHGCGNDYLFLDRRERAKSADNARFTGDLPALARKLCDRRFSVGGDGLVVISSSGTADCKMRIFNADGGEAETCGNALRCVAKHICFTEGKTAVSIETASGIRRAKVEGEKVSVEMGRAVFRAENLPPVGNFSTIFEGKTLSFTAVSVGNPHAVCFVREYDFDLLRAAQEVAEGFFPKGSNVEFLREKGDLFQMRVIERGSGETLCCGSGACAAAAVAVRDGLKKPGRIAVECAGGRVEVDVKDDFSLILTGPAEYSFSGELI